jgi:superfamily II DNA or RNA helicase
MELRDYQARAIELLRQEIARGIKRPLLFLATGGGKGLIMSQITSDALAKGNKVLTVMRRREIIFQTVKNYKKYHNIDASVVMNGHSIDYEKPCQVASIDTIRARLKSGKIDFLKSFNICIVDEAHDSNAPSYQDFFTFMGDKYFIAFSATPFKIGKKPLKFWQSSVRPINAVELRDLGFLAPVKIFAPSTIKTDNVKISKGEFDQGQLVKNANAITGDIIKTYSEKANGLPAILFAINKEHSVSMSTMFNNYGIPAIHQDESNDSEERASAIAKLISGEIKVLCNINIFSTGVDVPCLHVGIMARPTMSEILWVQQVGRLLRPFLGKTCALILDHAGNTIRHGGPYRIRESCLESEQEKKENIEKQQVVTTCKFCFAVFDGSPQLCPECKMEIKKNKKQREVTKIIDGELVEFNDDACHINRKFEELKKISKEKSYKSMWAWFKIYDLYGNDIYNVLNVPPWAERILSARATTVKF